MNIEVEWTWIECKKCKVIKKRYLDGKYPNGKDKRWIDETGGEYSGSTCPPCHRKVCKEANKRRRLKEGNYNE